MKLRPFILSRSGSALVTTLLVIVVLTIIVTAFLQSMTMERQTARSYLNRYRADLAANAAQNSAMQMLKENFTNFPDSVTWWDPDLASKGVGGTVFSYYKREAASDPTQATDANSFYLPLVSGAIPQNTTAKGSSITLAGDEPDLNSTTNLSLLEDGLPWIGSISGVPTTTIKVPWVYLKDQSGNRVSRYAFWVEDESFRVNINVSGKKPRGNDTDGISPSEIPMQGSFKGAGIDEGTATSLAGKVVDLRTLLGDKVVDQKLLTASEIGYADSPPSPDNYKKARFLLTTFSRGSNLSRTGSIRLNLNGLNAADPNKTALADVQSDIDKIKAAINFRPDGSAAQDFDFGNRYYRTSTEVQNSPKAVPNDASDPRREIYVTKLAANIRDYIDADSSPTQVDFNGTVVFKRPVLPVGGKLQPGVAAQNTFWAIGQENVPRLTKTMLHVAQVTQMLGDRKKAPFKIRISYYLEFWNMSTKTIKVGTSAGEKSDAHTTYLDPSTFIRIGNQPGWVDRTVVGQAVPEDRPYDVDLSTFTGLEFPPGALTVLTTDPFYKDSAAFLHFDTLISANPKRIYVTSADLDKPNLQLPSGEVNPAKLSGYSGYATLDCDLRNTQNPKLQDNPTSTPKEDVGTYVLLGDNKGILDSQRAAVPIKPGIFVDAFGVKNDQKTMHFRGGTLPGNLPTAYDMSQTKSDNVKRGGYPYQLGDPRASCDSLYFDPGNTFLYPATTTEPGYSHVFPSWRADDPNAYKQSANNYLMYSIMGFSKAQAFSNVKADSPTLNPYDTEAKYRWDDAGSSMDLGTAKPANLTYAPGSISVIADDKLKSIGELGNIYDPAFYAPDNITYSRGGGRTLRIGQSEMPRFTGDPAAQWDGVESSASRARVAWRLCDIFSTTDLIETPGAININGIQRDNGAALLSALEGFSMSGADSTNLAAPNDQGEPAIDKKSLKEDGKELIAELVNYIKDNGTGPHPMRERGQLSELPFFNRPSPEQHTLIEGVTMGAETDRTREQLFRRLVELTTTKGTVYTAYVVGQAIRDRNGTSSPEVLSTIKRKVTFRLIPKFNDPKLDSNDPEKINDWTTNADFTDPDIKRRFKAPDHYDVEVLRVTN